MEGDFLEEKVAMAMGEEDKFEEEVRAWSWGAASDGQLGTGTLEDQLLPQALLNFPPISSSAAASRIAQIACGGAHSIALTGNDQEILLSKIPSSPRQLGIRYCCLLITQKPSAFG